MERNEMMGLIATMVQVALTTILCVMASRAQAPNDGLLGLIIGASIAGAYLRGKHGV